VQSAKGATGATKKRKINPPQTTTKIPFSKTQNKNNRNTALSTGKLPNGARHAIVVCVVFVSGDVFGKAIVLANGACLARIRHRGQSVLSGANSSGGADVARPSVGVVPTTTVAGNAMLKCLLCCSAIALLSKMNLPLGQRLHIVLLLTDDVDGRYIDVHPNGTDFAHHLFLCVVV